MSLNDGVVRSRQECGGFLEAGKVREVFEWCVRDWPSWLGRREVAVIGDDEQEWSYRVRSKRGEYEQKYHGWREVLGGTGLGMYTRGGLDFYVVMGVGGADGVAMLEGVKLSVGVYRGDKRVGSFKVEDDTRMLFDGKENRELEVLVLESERLNKKYGNGARDSDEYKALKLKLAQHGSWIKRKRVVVRGAIDKLIGVLDSVRVEEETKEGIAVGQG